MSGLPERPAGPQHDVDLLRAQIEDLRSALDAIRSGGVDAVVMNTSDGEQVYPLAGADRSYRVIVEEMGEGAATISERGVVLYVNHRLTELLRCDRGFLLGKDSSALVAPDHQAALADLLQIPPGVTRRAELELAAETGPSVPVQVSVAGLDVMGVIVRCVVATDLTDRRHAEQEIAAANEALRVKATELEEAQRVAHVGSWIWDRAADRVDLSVETASIFLLPPTAEPLTFTQVFAGPGLPGQAGLVTVRDEALRGNGAFVHSLTIRLPDGSLRHVLIRGEVLRDRAGRATGMRGTVQDVTALTEARQALERSTAQFVAAFEHAPVAMALVDVEGGILHANQALSELTGISLDQLTGRSLDAFVRSLDGDKESKPGFPPVATLVSRFDGEGSDEESPRTEARLVTADGYERWINLRVAPVLDIPGDHYAVVHLEDISDRKCYETQLRYLADHDPLTGLLNRRGFRDMLEHHRALATRHRHQSVMVLFDLDNFKDINDTLGHSAGDALLRAIARAVLGRIRGSDVFARLGGDEFGVLLAGVDAGGATALARDLLAVIGATVLDVGETSVHTTASAGIALVDATSTGVDEIVSNADLAMYTAKRAGGDRSSLFDAAGPTAACSRAGFVRLERIREGLEQGRFELLAQPIMHLPSDRISGCELLLRLREGDRLLDPGEFLDIAQSHGLAPAIDRFVVGQAVRVAARTTWPPGFCWEINLTADALSDPSLPELIEVELRSLKVCPRSLIFEITETAAISNLHQAKAFASAVRNLGCRFAVDNFGRGYGSFYHLKHLPLDYVKIDGEFIRDLPASYTDRVIVESIARTARRLGLKTVAEYVLDRETLDLLRTYEVDYVQGFHIGRPTDPAAFAVGYRGED